MDYGFPDSGFPGILDSPDESGWRDAHGCAARMQGPGMAGMAPDGIPKFQNSMISMISGPNSGKLA